MTIIKKIERSFSGFIVTHPKAVLAVFLLCAGTLGWQARKFEINASAETLLMKDDKNYIQTQVMNRRFSPQEFLLVAYKPKNHPVLSEKTFKDIRSLSKKLRQLDRVQSVSNILNVPLWSKLDSGLSADTDLSQMTIEKHDYTMDEIRGAFKSHPIYEDILMNKDQTVTSIQIRFKKNKEVRRLQNQILDLQQISLNGQLSEKETKDLERLKKEIEPIEKKLDKIRTAEIREIRKIVAEYEDDVDIYLGGLHVLAFQLISIIENDLVIFGIAIAVMICLILFFLFRKIRWVLIPTICCVCSVLSTLGLFGILGLKATVISSSFVALQLILTLAIAIHLIVQYRECSTDHPDWRQDDLVKETISRKAGPCFYAGFINLIGFASLLFGNLKPVVSFGWMMSISMFFSIGVSLILFPALMALFAKENIPQQKKFSGGFLRFFTNLALRHGFTIVLVSACVLIASAAGIFRLDVENSFINYFKSTTQVNKELSFIDKELGGSTPLDIVYTIPGSDRKKDLVITADTVQVLQNIQQTLQQHPAVGKMLSLVNFTELAKNINGGKPLTEYELTAMFWSLDGSMKKDLLGSFFSPKNAQVRFSARIKDTTKGLSRTQLLEDIRQDMKKLGIPEENYKLTNLFILYQDILQRLYESQILTLGISFGVLTLTILVVFRSLKIALIGITPNILSTLMILGIMGWLGIPLDLMTIMIAAVAMGITVDDTIHYIDRYMEELHKGTEEQAVERSHASVAYALVYTSLIVILGFSLLAFSDFVPSILFGLLTGLAMALALLFDLSILPVLLRKFVHRPAQKLS